MSVVKSIFRATRRLPLLRQGINFLLRAGRNLFWSLRPAYMAGSTEIPADFIALVTAHIPESQKQFLLAEAGCGDGRVLRHLAQRYTQAGFVGVDLQKAAIELGNQIAGPDGSRIRLICGSYLDNDISLECDYLISRAALIYLDPSEIKIFLRKRLPQVKVAAILQEVVSTTDRTETSHFFAHPLADLIEEVAPGHFLVVQETLDYQPWKGEKWTGANLVATRKPNT
jgi:SAM-dependent methyltransferase